jgi:hypothetical protein
MHVWLQLETLAQCVQYLSLTKMSSTPNITMERSCPRMRSCIATVA